MKKLSARMRYAGAETAAALHSAVDCRLTAHTLSLTFAPLPLGRVCCSESAQLLLARYVELHGLAVQQSIRQATVSARGSGASGCRGCTGVLSRRTDHCTALRCVTALQASAPRPESPAGEMSPSCSPFVLSLLERLLSMQAELCELLPKKKAASGTGATTDESRQSASSSSSSSASAPSFAGGSRLSSSSTSSASSSSHHPTERLAQRDIARLFTVRVPTYAPVRMNRVDPLAALLRIALQCWVECARCVHVESAAQLAQLEVDLHALEQRLPHSVQQEQHSDEGRVLWAQMDDVRRSLSERCSERLQDRFIPPSRAQLEQALDKAQQAETQRQRQRQRGRGGSATH